MMKSRFLKIGPVLFIIELSKINGVFFGDLSILDL